MKPGTVAVVVELGGRRERMKSKILTQNYFTSQMVYMLSNNSLSKNQKSPGLFMIFHGPRIYLCCLLITAHNVRSFLLDGDI